MPLRGALVTGVLLLILVLLLPSSLGAARGASAASGAPHAGILTPRGSPPARFGPNSRVFVSPPGRAPPTPPVPGNTVDEPAPTGISDIGMTGTGTSTPYTTSDFIGIADISQLSTYDTTLADYGFPDTALSLQLNVIVTFTVAGTPYQFWIQNVVSLDSSDNNFQMINNIWNFSSGSGAMDSSSVQGNGTVYDGGGYNFYEDNAPLGQAGNNVDLTYPSIIQVRVHASVVAGTPYVAFGYEDGYGWQWYDNASFPFAKGVSSALFRVDGTQTTGLGLPYDAEWVLGGPGSGSQTIATQMNAKFSLEYWDGVNYESIPNAYAYGEDTAEGISQINVANSVNDLNGSLGAHLTLHDTFGAGSLGLVYDRSFSSFVNLSTSLSSGNLSINGTTSMAFHGGPINLTLAPGTYRFDVEVGGLVYATGTGTLLAGGYLAIDLTAAETFLTTISSEGLTGVDAWSITVAGTLLTTTPSGAISLVEANGTYPFTVGGVSGWRSSPASGTIEVAQADQELVIHWQHGVFVVTFTEDGLPAGTGWNITVNGTRLSSSTTNVSSFSENGEIQFHVESVPGWQPNPPSGTIDVDGANVNLTINWTQVTYTASIVETGLPAGTVWTLEFDGTAIPSGSPLIHLVLPNGSYQYSVLGIAGFSALPRSSLLTVDGSNLTQLVSWSVVQYTVTFRAVGLPPDVYWQVTVRGQNLSSTDPSQTLVVPNGSYPYSIAAGDEYAPSLASGAAIVDGKSVSVNSTFGLLPGILSGVVAPGTAQLVLGANQSVPIVNGNYSLRLAPGTYLLTATDPGYAPFAENVTVPAGQSLTVNVVLQALPVPAHIGVAPSSGLSASELTLGLLVGVAAVGIALVLAARRRRTAAR
ncbi:MAG: thermopsin family protease [Thermoplasmata archaeon]|nr:thermopsin family protease [Thermoplasmata archaeon]